MNDDQINALISYLDELQNTINYGADIPHAFKVDMCNKLHRLKLECGFKFPEPTQGS